MLKIYKYVNQFFYAIFISKFVFYKPNQSDILLYDQGSTFNGLVKKTLKNYKISIILVRLEEINLYVVISLIIKLKFLNKGSLFFNYIVEYCEHIRPKLILTSNNLDLKFYKLKESLSYKVKIGCVQRTPIYENHLLFFKKKLKLDIFFCFSKNDKAVYKKYFNTNFSIIGSFNNNFYKLKKKNARKKSFLLISGFKEQKDNPYLDTEYEKNLTKYLINFSKNYNFTFKILLKPYISPKNYLEYNNINKKFILPNYNSPYQIMDQHNLIVLLTESTMGLEAVARGTKHVRITKLKFKKNNFYTLNKKLNQKNINEFLKRFLILSNGRYFSYFKKKEKLTKFDPGNKLFKLEIKKLIGN